MFAVRSNEFQCIYRLNTFKEPFFQRAGCLNWREHNTCQVIATIMRERKISLCAVDV